MNLDGAARRYLEIWRLALVESVRQDSPDLSARQLSVLLTVYLTPGPHTVRGLAQSLNVSKPAITRALDTLSRLSLIKRRRDDDDRRSVLVVGTAGGSDYLKAFSDLIAAATDVFAPTAGKEATRR